LSILLENLLRFELREKKKEIEEQAQIVESPRSTTVDRSLTRSLSTTLGGT
jgi:hypothetical protein